MRWSGPLLVLLLTFLCLDARGATSRYRYEAANASINGGDGYKTADNANATLAWGESYIMVSYMVMYRATGDLMYLDRLADHADHVLQSRDDLAGLTEYSGSSSPCWRNTKYQPNNEPYCYVVHSGMLTWPMVDFAVAIYGHPELWSLTTWDGTTYKEKADLFVQRAEETVAYHDFQWSNGPGAGEGHYVFDPGAAFLDFAGQEMPLNQQNAMGRSLVSLHLATGDPAYLDKASRLAKRFDNQLTLSNGAYLWNYWGGSYSPPGEDVSHAAINVDFARLCAENGIVFDEVDLKHFGDTFFVHVYKDSDTIADHVGGSGSVNGSGYKPQIARWLNLAPYSPAVYTIVRNVYDGWETETGSGSLVLGFALLALHEPEALSYFFYYADWALSGDVMTATANNANILAAPPDPEHRYMVPVTFRTDVPVTGQQWDGEAYHTVVHWAATGGAFRTLWLTYMPEWWHQYWSEGALFQFTEAPFEGMQVKTSPEPEPPQILTDTLPDAWTDETWQATLEAAGTSPFVWTIVAGPAGLTVSWDTGQLTWDPVTAPPGDHPVTVSLDTDWGDTTSTLTLTINTPDNPEPDIAEPDIAEPEPDIVEPEPDIVEPEPDIVEPGSDVLTKEDLQAPPDTIETRLVEPLPETITPETSTQTDQPPSNPDLARGETLSSDSSTTDKKPENIAQETTNSSSGCDAGGPAPNQSLWLLLAGLAVIALGCRGAGGGGARPGGPGGPRPGRGARRRRG